MSDIAKEIVSDLKRGPVTWGQVEFIVDAHLVDSRKHLKSMLAFWGRTAHKNHAESGEWEKCNTSICLSFYGSLIEIQKEESL